MTSKLCREKLCQLSSWVHTRENKCLFHEEDAQAIAVGLGREYRELVREYLDSAETLVDNTKNTWSKDELYVNVAKVEDATIDALKGHIIKRVTFERCIFKSSKLLTDEHFKARISFWNCTFGSGDETSQVHFQNCRFFKALTIISNNPLKFTNCEFHDENVLNSGTFDERPIPSLKRYNTWPSVAKSDALVVLENCKFALPGVVTLRSRSYLIISGGEASAELIVKAAGVDIQQLSGNSTLFQEGVMIMQDYLNECKCCFLDSAKINGTLVIGEDEPKTGFKPNIRMGGLKSSTGKSLVPVIFKNINLANYFGDMRIANSQFAFENVKFGRKWGRVHLKTATTDWKLFQKPRYFQQRERNVGKYESMEEDYRWLKSYFHDLGHAQLENQFYASELNAQWRARVVASTLPRALFRRFLSLDAWYCRLSNFGLSLARPIIWLFVSTILAASYYDFTMYDGFITIEKGHEWLPSFKSLNAALRVLTLNRQWFTTELDKLVSDDKVRLFVGATSVVHLAFAAIIVGLIALVVRRRYKISHS